MKNSTSAKQSIFFEVDNARNLSKQQLVSTFIPTTTFSRLLSRKHHIVFGARGQGKTALVKMISMDHLVLFAERDDYAKQIIDKQEFIGIYMPTKLEWVGALKSKIWKSTDEKEKLFQWKVNLSSCLAFLISAKSCINYYINNDLERIKIERAFCKKMSSTWDISLEDINIETLGDKLENISYEHQFNILKQRINDDSSPNKVGIAFQADLFVPLKRAIKELSLLLKINHNCAWLLCIDEAEFLDIDCQKILNSHMRTVSDNLFLKITTMPFCHYTLATTNPNATLNVGHDFDYISMESDSIITTQQNVDEDSLRVEFGQLLFEKICDFTNNKSLDCNLISQILGSSPLLDGDKDADWSSKSKNFELLTRYANAKTRQRALELKSEKSSRFHDEIIRKVHGALLLRDAIKNCTGNKSLTIYSGSKMVIRCADNNPRRLIRLFNMLFIKIRESSLLSSFEELSQLTIKPATQNKVLESFAEMTLNQVRSLEKVGPSLYDLLMKIGQYMQYDLHEKLLATDQVCSIEIDHNVTNEDWDLIQVAIGQGLLFSNTPDSVNYGVSAVRSGKYHLAYVLAPHFRLLPRKGKSVKLRTLKSFNVVAARKQNSMAEDISLFQDEDFDNE